MGRMRNIRWFIGLVFILAGVWVLIILKFPVVNKYFAVFLCSGFLVLYRIFRGPTAADRAVASDVLGILIIGICSALAIFTKKAWYMDIAIAWALQSFIGVLALAKYLEGKNFDE